MKTLVENRPTVICLQALNWETVQRLRAALTQHCSSPPLSPRCTWHISLSNKSIYIRRAGHEQIKSVISICTTGSFDLLTCRAWILPLWIRFSLFTKTKVIWHVIQFGVSLGPALFKQGSGLARLKPVCAYLHREYFNWFKSCSTMVPKESIFVFP